MSLRRATIQSLSAGEQQGTIVITHTLHDALAAHYKPHPKGSLLLTLKEVSNVATKDEYLNAAKVKPSNRTSAEQALVERGKNMQDVRNADHEARRQERAFGK